MSGSGARGVVCDDDGGGRSHLFVDGGTRRCRIVLDQRALVVWSETDIIARMPLRRIDRVTTTGDALWQADALAALGQAGVPLGVIDGQGVLRALLLPGTRRRATLRDTLARLSGRSDWADRLEDWCRAEISHHARAMGLPDPAAAARGGFAVACEALAAAVGENGHGRRWRLTNHARAFAMLLAQRVLTGGGCPAAWRGHDPDPRRDLTQILARIALWRLARQASVPRRQRVLRSALAGARAGSARPDRRRILDMAERIARPVQQALGGDLHRLHLHLVELVELRGARLLLPAPGRNRQAHGLDRGI